MSVDKIFYLNMAIALGIQTFLQEYINKHSVQIKWPNDIYVNEKKIAGILIQNQINSKGLNTSIIGIGVNINQTKFNIPDGSPTSLSLLTDKSYNLDDVYKGLFESIDKQYVILRTKQYEILKQRYIGKLLNYKKYTRFKLTNESSFFGEIIDINENGSIVIFSKDGRRSFMNHDIRMIM